MTPLNEGVRFLWGMVTGAALGLVYDFLRPLRPKHTALADSLFALAALYAFLVLHFGLCDARLRFAYTVAMAPGALLWERSGGRLLRGVFSGFWNFWGKAAGTSLLPIKKTAKSA